MGKQHWPQHQGRENELAMPAARYFPKIDKACLLAEAIVESIREPLLVLDDELRVVTANGAFRHLFGVDRREVEGRPFHALGGGRWDIPELGFLLANDLPMEAREVERDIPGTGRRTMLLNARKLFSERDAPALVLLTIEDITERRAAERQTAALLRQKETLLQEMPHRIANSLQIIASMLLLKARAARSEEVRRHLGDTHQRILAVAAVQQQFSATRQGERIDLAPYLSRLCAALAASLVGDSRPIAIRAQVDNAEVPSATAVSIGLVVTELVINALKHAFVADTAGLVVVAYAATGAGWRLAVSDNGIGKSGPHIDGANPRQGMRIVRALARQLDGRVKISMGASGTAVSITHGTPRLRPSHAP